MATTHTTSGTGSLLATTTQALRGRWAALSAREQRGLRVLGALLLAAVVWTLLLAPALRTLNQAGAQHRALDAGHETMLRLQQRALALQSQTPVSASQAQQAIQTAATVLGTGVKVQVLGDQVTLTLQRNGAPELAQWLAQPADGLALQPAELHLQRDPGDKLTWSGTVRFVLPQGSESPR